MIANVIAVTRGLNAGLSLHSSNLAENSVRAGRNDTVTVSTLQTAQAYSMLELAAKAFSAAGRPSLPLLAQRIIYLFPLALGYLLEKTKNETAHDALLFLHDRVGTACQCASLVLSVTMVFFGHAYYGYACLLALTIGYLDRTQILPENARHLLHTYFDPALFALSLFTAEGKVEFVLSLLFLLSSIDEYFKEKPLPPVVSPAEPNLLKVRQFSRISRGAALQIQPTHLHERPSPPVPEEDIGEIVTLFDAIEWNEDNQAQLRVLLWDDERFLQDHQTVEGKTHEKLLAYARQGIQTLVETIRDGKISEGEPADYTRAREYLQTITHELKALADPSVKAGHLLTLAVRGGAYCGPGKYEAVEQVYGVLVPNKEDLHFRTRLLLCLQDYRRSLFDRVFFTTFSKSQTTLTNFLGYFDLHKYNAYVKTCGPMYALNKLSAENDSVALVNSIARRIYRGTFGGIYAKVFQRKHTPREIVWHLQEIIGTPRLPLDQFEGWLRGWIRREVPDTEGQEKFLETMTNGEHFINTKDDLHDWLKRWVDKELSEVADEDRPDKLYTTIAQGSIFRGLDGYVESAFQVAQEEVKKGKGEFYALLRARIEKDEWNLSPLMKTKLLCAISFRQQLDPPSSWLTSMTKEIERHELRISLEIIVRSEITDQHESIKRKMEGCRHAARNKDDFCTQLRTAFSGDMASFSPRLKNKLLGVIRKAENGIVRASFIKALLVDMGVLQFPTADPRHSD